MSNVNLRRELIMRWRRRSTTDFSDEIEAHVALETDRLIAEGMPPEDAARAARQAFGNLTVARERYYEAGRRLWLDHLAQDLRAAARSLVRYPVVSAVAVLSLAAGIASTAASLTIRDIVFQNPPPLYRNPEQLSKVQVNRQDRPIRPAGSYVPGDLYGQWAQILGASVAAASARDPVTDVRIADRVEPTPVRRVSPTLFPLLGVPPEIGRGFAASGAGQAVSPEAVLSHRLWRDWFGGRPDVLGQTLWIDNKPHTIVGVMPQRFWYGSTSNPVWTRLDPVLSADEALQVVVRRPTGQDPAALSARLEGPLAQYSQRLAPGVGPLQMRVSPVKGTPMGEDMSLLLPFVLGMAVVLTLLIACANVSILMVAQWTRREAETAVRAALGASRPRLVRAFLVESLLLAALAGALGIGGTYVLHAIMLKDASIVPAFLDVSIHVGVLIKSIAITLLAGLVAGLGPALMETRRLQFDPLRGIAASDRVRQRWSHALVVLEITFTLALLVVTSSMIGGVTRAMSSETGFDPRPLLAAMVERPAGVPVGQLADRLRQIPGVGAVAATTAVPLAGSGPRQAVSTEATGGGTTLAERISIGPGFFSTLGVPMKVGRPFTTVDRPETRAVVVNEALAARLFGAQSPIGRQIWFGRDVYEVIGVVSDYMSNPVERRTTAPQAFFALSEGARDLRTVRFLVRASGDPAALVQPVRRSFRDAVPGLVVSNTFTLEQIRTVQGQEALVGTAPLFPLIVIGMLLMSSGLYGVLAFAVSRRTRELAVRMAIGAEWATQVRLVMAQSLRLAVLGSACGIALTFGLSRLVRAAGGEGSLYDPAWPAFVLPVFLVLVVAMLATWVPARRALRVDPARLLRST
jgi:putative ABC transport system permease protein